MKKRVILITGTPCIGKTALAKQLTPKLNAVYVNLTLLAKTHNLTIGEDKTRRTTIIDQGKLRVKIVEILNNSEKKTIIVDSHYAAAIVPKRFKPYIFVLRRNPVELRKFMEKRGFSETKMWENIASEILDVCLVEALQEHEKKRVCELDITGKPVKDVMNEVLAVLNEGKKCGVGNVDWLGMLEKDGLVDEYLKV